MSNTDKNLIPKPVGYHLLVMMPAVDDTYAGGIVKSAKAIHEETVLNMVGLVMAMGDQAYSDEERFPTGPWCEVGDYVVFRSNSGTRFKVEGQEYRILNDDSIEATVADPRAITRAS